uniref:DDE Tnp4 domain-containing protein n=1 Tax=Pelodiscus sinensis TaxID=13735 RepID=K7EXP0_PELSI
MVLQALVNHRGQFTDICVEWSGREHDARIFWNSYLYCRLGHSFRRETLHWGMCRCLCASWPMGVALMPWLMKPFSGHLDASRELFNSHLNWACFQEECAFGRLKKRFRCRLTQLDIGERDIPKVVAACCVLHNLVERKGETFLPGWGTRADVEGRQFEQPRTAAIRQAHQVGLRIPEAVRERFSQRAQ